MGRIFTHLFAFVVLCAISVAPLHAAPYAAVVMDARTGEVLHSRSADQRLHPASLTKMMTLYVVFEAVEHGEIGLDTEITIPAAAAAEPPSRLGLRTGQKIKLRYLIRAAAIKSANDAATALAFAIEGSEAAFARRMNRTAQALGMTRTTFRNAHGLTQEGHRSTARDMTKLGRHLIYDFPQYYNIFSRTSDNAGIARVNHTNRRFLNSYRGADGIKTGYTRAAGFNLTASAERGSTRIIATMFGGSSTAQRNARVAELLDMGFARAPANARLRRPTPPPYGGSGSRSTGQAPNGSLAGVLPNPSSAQGARTIRISGAVTRSLRPRARPVPAGPTQASLDSTLAIQAALAQKAQAPEAAEATTISLTQVPVPQPRPASLPPQPAASQEEIVQEVVARLSTSGARDWGINVGRYTTRYQAERVLLKIALNEMESLDGTARRVASSARGHDATFMGLTRDQAERACARLQAKSTPCMMISP